MTKSLFNKKTALRFKLVQKSVRDLQGSGGADNEDDLDQGIRVFAPLNRAAREYALSQHENHFDEERAKESSQVSRIISTSRFTGINNNGEKDDEGENDVGVDTDIDVDVDHVSKTIKHEPGEASKFGIFYDDRNYDYTRHLKKIGESSDGVFIAASKVKGKAGSTLVNLEQMFADAERGEEESEMGADKDPAVQEVLEALEDEAYEDDNFEDDFIVRLDRHGEANTAILCPVNYLTGFTIRKKSKPGQDKPYDSSLAKEDIDTQLERILKSWSIAEEGYSSNDSLDNLKIDYNDNNDENEEDENSDDQVDEGSIGEQEIEEAMDDFLSRQNEYLRPTVQERKMGAIEFLDELRKEMGPISPKILDRELSDTEKEEREEFLDSLSSAESEHFDCQSIITTFTTTENLPAIIKESRKYKSPLGRDEQSLAIEPIRISRRGMAIVEPTGNHTKDIYNENDSDVEDGKEIRINKGQGRSKDETSEEKRIRKAAIKEERRQNRAAKKQLKVSFRLGEAEALLEKIK